MSTAATATGGKPPRIPVHVVTPQHQKQIQENDAKPPLPSKATTTTNAATNTTAVVNNPGVDAELEALKQRGLAKILNKHFTETTKKLAQEKAAADAAIQDLENRKSRTSEFHASKTSELSPLEEMCVKANQWRAECRRKERETILLYQRYVHKFGDTGVVTLPHQQSYIPDAKPDTNRTAAPALPRKNNQNQQDMVASSLVPDMTNQIEATLEEYLKQGGLSMPSAQLMGKDQTFQAAHEKEELEFRMFYRRQLEQRGVDAKAQCGIKITERADYPGYVIPPDDDNNNNNVVDVFRHNYDEDHIDAAVAATEATLMANSSGNLPMNTIDEVNDVDDCSVVSGLTTLHSAMTREVLQECERSVAEFLREEQENIRRIMNKESSNDNNDDMMTLTSTTSYTVGDASMKAKEAETMVQQMEEILNEYQSKQNAATTQQQHRRRRGGGPIDSDSEDDLHRNRNSSSRQPRRYDTGDPSDEWYIYYDDFYQQEYYHEKNTNRTQWEPPLSSSSGGGGTHNSEASDSLSHNEVMPEFRRSGGGVGVGGTLADSRIRAFRRKRRRQKRRRRRMLGFLLVLCAFLAIMYFYVVDRMVLKSPEVMDGTMSVQDKLLSLWREQWEEWTGVAKARREQEALAAEQQRQLEEEAARRERNKEQAQQEQKQVIKRPWACKFPLAHLFHPRCREVADNTGNNPWFDLSSILDMMFQ